jgi:hypothetical protein
VPAARPCVTCPKRTGANTALFDDFAQATAAGNIDDLIARGARGYSPQPPERRVPTEHFFNRLRSSNDVLPLPHSFK